MLLLVMQVKVSLEVATKMNQHHDDEQIVPDDSEQPQQVVVAVEK
jgi:hypothetical protein